MNDQLNIYDRLLLLPLFQGMNKTDLTLVAGQTKFGFQRHQQGRTIVSEGDSCDQLHFLMQGTLEVTTHSADHTYSIIESLPAPAILQPEHIFGLTQRYTRSFVAQTPCNMMSLDKSEVMRLTEEFIVFRLNLLNIISTQSQRLQRRLWLQPSQDLKQSIVRFIEARCQRPTGKKTVLIKMTRLAELLNDSRLNVSRALNSLQSQGLLTLSRGRIEIEDLRQLLP